MPIRLDSSATGGISGGGSNFTHVSTAGRGRKSLVVMVTAEWSGSPAVTSVTFNGVTGTLLASQLTSGPSYMGFYYWLDSVLPGPGSITARVNGPGGNCAAGTMMFTGVDQDKPFGPAVCRYVGSLTLKVSLQNVTNQGAVLAAAAIIGSNTLSANAPLQDYISKNSPNAFLGMAWCPLPYLLTTPGFTSTGDSRLSMGAVPIREYVYPAGMTRARRFTRAAAAIFMHNYRQRRM